MSVHHHHFLTGFLEIIFANALFIASGTLQGALSDLACLTTIAFTAVRTWKLLKGDPDKKEKKK